MSNSLSSFSLEPQGAFCNLRRSLEEIYRGRSMHVYQAGQNITMHPHEVWVVCRGVVQLNTLHPSGDEVLVGFTSQGMPFGLPLTALDPYSAMALSDVGLIRFTLAEVDQNPHLRQEIWHHLNRRLQQTECLLALVSNKRVEERLRQILLLLKREIGQPIEGGTRITVRLTHQHLANAISSTRVTVTRAMKQLQGEGWLRMDHNRYIVLVDS